MDRPTIQIGIPIGHAQRRELRTALLEAAAGRPGGPWRVRLDSALIYRTPREGEWWWRVRLTSAAGQTRTLVVSPQHQTRGFLVELLSKAFSGELFTVVCAWCARVQLSDESWQNRPELKEQARHSHGICPDCVQKLYPQTVRRSKARRH